MPLAKSLPLNGQERIVKTTDKTQTGNAAANFTGSRPSYIELAGTNIEDFDRALKAGTWHLPAAEPAEPEITA
jgi:hypothetical protein